LIFAYEKGLLPVANSCSVTPTENHADGVP